MNEFETTIEVAMNIKVRFSVHPEEKMTRHYPGCPAHVDDMEFILITTEYPNKQVETAIENDDPLHDIIYASKNDDEWQEMCFESVREDDEERQISRYEDRRDA